MDTVCAGQINNGGGFSSSWSLMRMDEHISIDDRDSDQLGQSNSHGGFLSSWSQVRTDEHISVDGGNGDQSTFSVQVGVGSGNTNNRARGANSEMFLQVVQQGFSHAHMILEQNRMLMQDICQNKENCGKDELTRNVKFLRHLNTNIGHVFDLYSNMSGSFTNYIATRNTRNTDKTNASGDSDP